MYLHKQPFNIKEIEKTCFNLMAQEWEVERLSKPKLRTYNIFKYQFGVDMYVSHNVDRFHRSICAQFRSGILPLLIETGRYTIIKDKDTNRFRNMTVPERVCPICKSDQVEDEKHFLFECVVYHEDRLVIFQNTEINFNTLMLMTNDDKLIYFMNTDWKSGLKLLVTLWNDL